MKLLYVLWIAFAWAIGGEKHFGKWRRGALILPAILISGLFMPIVWWLKIIYLFTQSFLAWVIYQALFYDDCIAAIYDEGNIGFGVSGLLFNGFIIGTQPALYLIFLNKYITASVALIVVSLAMPAVVWLSNSLKISIPISWKIGGVGIFNPADGWWLSCFILGATIGVWF